MVAEEFGHEEEGDRGGGGRRSNLVRNTTIRYRGALAAFKELKCETGVILIAETGRPKGVVFDRQEVGPGVERPR